MDLAKNDVDPSEETPLKDNTENKTSENGAAQPVETCTASSPIKLEDELEDEAKDEDAVVEIPSWKVPFEPFANAKYEKAENKKVKKRVRKFYKKQNELIEEFENIYYECPPTVAQARQDSPSHKRARKAEICAKVSFAANFLLLIGKLVAVVLSGSLSILSSLVDSAVDLTSGIVMWCTSSAMKRRDVYKYPSGKRRMEPLSILVLSIIMSMASAMVIIEGIQQIRKFATSEDPDGPSVDIATIVLICVTIVTKFILFMTMRRVQTPSVQALAQDHRNDVISNTSALIMGFIGSRYWRYADPLGAILIAIYILISWCSTAYEQIKMLTGLAANLEFQKKITWLAINHSPEIVQLDTVLAHHYGINFLVEVHIVLPPEMSVRQAHDIQESLQSRLESLEEVERAFVHIDYEAEHDPQMEHKML